MLHFAREQEEEITVKIKSPKDFWAGVMFIVVGLFFLGWAVTYYQMGTSVRMGPAYFPAVLGGMLAVLGGIVMLGSLAISGPPIAKFHYRPLILISLACVVYGYLMKPAGLIVATAALVFISAYGGHEFKWKEVTILYLLLIVFSILVFVKGLTLPFPICPDFMERCPIR
jgi:putative tricarboxylic transport membrane protein